MKTHTNLSGRALKRGLGLLTLALCMVLFNVSCKKDQNTTPEQQTTLSAGDYIVVLNDANVKMAKLKASSGISYKQGIAQTQNQMSGILQSKGIDPTQVYNTYCSAILGFAAHLDAQQASLLANDKDVQSIELDKTIQLQPIQPKIVAKAGAVGDIVPWGIQYIGGPQNGVGKTAWVIDTGIDIDHPNLNVDASRGVNLCSLYPANSSPNDDNGHGTHVAGTIAAKYTGNGLVGVAAGATVIPVKVVNQNGGGYESDCVRGVDYVAYNARYGDVVNMSLGYGLNSAIDQAVRRAAEKGIKFAIAAGNERRDAIQGSPQRVVTNGVVKVAAIDKNGRWADFSNYGEVVDVAAPGVEILSTYKDGQYATLQGTSMASPHVAGLLLLGKQLHTKGDVYCPYDRHYYPLITL